MIDVSIRTKGLILVLVPVLFEIVFVSVLSLRLIQEYRHFQQLQQSKELIRLTLRTHARVTRAFMIFCYSPRSEAIRRAAAEDIAREIKEEGSWEEAVRKIDAKNLEPDLLEIAEEVFTMKDTVLALTDELKDAARQPKNDNRMYTLALTFLPAMTDAMASHKRLEELNKRFRKELPDRERKKEKLTTAVYAGLLIGATVSLSLLWLFTRSIIARLKDSAHRAHAIAVGQSIQPPATSQDELGQLEREIYDAAVTIQKARERELAIHEGTSDLILSLDARLRFKTVGRNCHKFFADSQDQLLGRSLLSLVGEESTDDVREVFAAIRDARQAKQLELRFATGKGVTRYHNWTVHWSPEKQTFFCVARDVSEARRVEQLRQYFLSMAGHDLRSPLTAISINLELINTGLQGPVPDSLSEDLSMMEKRLSSLIAFVNELLDLEKLEATRSRLKLSGVSAAAVCGQALENIESLMEQQQVSVLFPKTDSLLFCDEDNVEKAVTSLLASCIRMSGQAEEIKLTISETPEQGIIEVFVPGLVIPAGEAESMFSKFRPVAGDASGAKPGLGLAIAEAVATMHGGGAGVIHQEQSGTAFWISLPRLSDDVEDQSAIGDLAKER